MVHTGHYIVGKIDKNQILGGWKIINYVLEEQLILFPGVGTKTTSNVSVREENVEPFSWLNVKCGKQHTVMVQGRGECDRWAGEKLRQKGLIVDLWDKCNQQFICLMFQIMYFV